MQEVNFEDALEIITLKDPRYPREAYLFVREALDHTQRLLAKEKQGGIRHVSGQELLGGIKDYAITQFGPMAMMVLNEWGIQDCQDFGELVFNMVETGGCPLLLPDDVLDTAALIARLAAQADPLSAYLWQNFTEPARKTLSDKFTPANQQELLAQELNRLITAGPLYQEDRFSGVNLAPETKRLVNLSLEGVPLAQLNRMLLEAVYPGLLARSHGLLAKTKDDSRADFADGYDFFEAFRKPFLPPSRQTAPEPDPAPAR